MERSICTRSPSANVRSALPIDGHALQPARVVAQFLAACALTVTSLFSFQVRTTFAYSPASIPNGFDPFE